MPPTKRRKTNKGGSRPSSRATTPVPFSRPESPAGDAALNPPLVLTSTKRRGVFECDYCHSDISQLPRIRCAECPDFDLCLECFVTTDHTSAIARLKASVEARTAVDNLTAPAVPAAAPPQAGGEPQHYGKKGPGPFSGALATPSYGSGAINHDDSHGYRVCDSTRYPMFPSARKVASLPLRPASNDDGAAAAAAAMSTTASTTDTGMSEEVEDDANNNKDKGGDAMDIDPVEKPVATTTATATDSSRKDTDSLVLIPDDPKAVWTAEEDLRLLDAIETHGLGNWTDIAEAMLGAGSSGKSHKRCMERFFDDYLGRYGHILPPYTLVDDNMSGEEKASGDATAMASNNMADDKSVGGASDGGGASSVSTATGVTSSLDPTRLSKRRHSIMVRTNSSASAQSFTRFKLKPVPTESLPEYQAVLKSFPKPKVPNREPEVQRGQEVLRDQSAKAEQIYAKAIMGLPTDEVEVLRKKALENDYLKPGGPTVLPERPEDVVKLPGAELAGFMPRRGDFDIEWEQEAETALADMEFLPGEPPSDVQLKLQVLQIYNEKLDEREKRKAFILSRNLHDYRKNQAADEELPRDERDLNRRMRLVERFHTPEEHKQFLADVHKAKRLRKEIAKLQMYRRIGITTEVEAERYELDKRRRSFHKTAVQKESSAAQSDDKATSAATAGEAASSAVGASGKKAELPEEKQSLWKGYRENSRGDRRRLSQDNVSCVSDAKATPEAAKVNEVQKEKGAEESKETTSADIVPDSTAEEKENDDFAIEEMEGFKFLTEKEADLCRRLKLTPKLYMDVKRVLIHESLKMGLLDKEESNNRRTIVKIDVEKRGHVVDFMVRAGYLRVRQGGPGVGSN